jgi:hypothetical protein
MGVRVLTTHHPVLRIGSRSGGHAQQQAAWLAYNPVDHKVRRLLAVKLAGRFLVSGFLGSVL